MVFVLEHKFNYSSMSRSLSIFFLKLQCVSGCSVKNDALVSSLIGAILIYFCIMEYNIIHINCYCVF